MKDDTRTKNRRVLAFTLVILGLMAGLVSYAPELYQLFCAATGFGGTIQRAQAPAPAEAAKAKGKTVTVYFDANVAPGLPWEFRPEKSRVVAKIGEPTRANYIARNNSDKTIVARAIFNVTPYKAAPYFFKIQCFCFTDEKLGPGESARMPLVFYVDDQLLKDPDTKEVRNLTLSYTFYEQKDLSEKEVAGARNLKTGSETTAAKLKDGKSVKFDNDAPRR